MGVGRLLALPLPVRPGSAPFSWGVKEADRTLFERTRCVLRAHLPIVSSYLEVLATAHSSPTVRQLAEIPRALVDSFPRSITFQTEREFLNKARDWRRSAKDAAVEFAELAGAGAQDDDEEGLKELMELLLGNEEVILERSEDWKEAVAAWGVWVNPGLRRDDLSYVIFLAGARGRS